MVKSLGTNATDLQDFLMCSDILKVDESVQDNQFDIVVTLLHNQLDVAAGSSLQLETQYKHLVEH